MEDEFQLSPEHRSVPSLKLWIRLAVVAAGCGFAGSKEPWAYGIVAALIAVSLLIAPPRSTVSRFMVWPMLLLALVLLGSFLPMGEAAMPGWRQTFVRDFGVALGGFRSPQPWASFETWMIVVIGLAWAWHCLGSGFNESERRWMMRMLALMVVLLALLAVWFKHKGIDVSFWQRSEWGLAYFGPFPNRNNFGGLLAMGAVLNFALVYDAYRRRSRWWPVFCLCILPIIWALLSNTSRAGLALFFIGLMAWMAFASFSRRSAGRMGVAAAVLVALIAVVILFGQHILGRMSLVGNDTSIGNDARIRVWADCWNMTLKTPFFGIGLGCFAQVFPFYQTYYDPMARYVHPESDWFWLAAEAGIPAVILLLVAIVNFTSRTGMWRSPSSKTSRTDRRLRNACAVAALILPLQSVVDTPAHQIGLVCMALLLAGLSLSVRRPPGEDHVSPATRTRLIFAAFCGFASLAWFTIAAGYPVLPGDSSEKILDRAYESLSDKKDFKNAKAVMNREIAMVPLHFYNYFERASVSLALGYPPNTALEDFARVRYLEPHLSGICQSEALVWLKYYPAFAPAAWREAMRRDSVRADEFYGWAVSSMRDHPEIRSSVRTLALTPRQKLSYLGWCNSAEFTEALDEILEQQPDLETFSSEEKLNLFQLWFGLGNRSQLLAKLEADATWRADGWPVLAEGRAAADDFRGAFQLALEHLEPPAESGGAIRKSEIPQLRREFLFHPTDFNFGFTLFEAESAKGLVNDALDTLDKVAQLPNVPPRVYYEQAVLLSRKGDHAAAWEKMKTYIEKWRVSVREAPSNAIPTKKSKEQLNKLLKRSAEPP